MAQENPSEFACCFVACCLLCMDMKIAEVKEMAPLSEAYELSADKKYLFAFKAQDISISALREFLANMNRGGIKSAAILIRNGDIKIFDLESSETGE